LEKGISYFLRSVVSIALLGIVYLMVAVLDMRRCSRSCMYDGLLPISGYQYREDLRFVDQAATYL
jgi:hypothetical protein